MAGNSFGLVYAEALPPDPRAVRTIRGVSKTGWATTKEFDDIAKDHCAAVLVTNLALIFEQRGYKVAAGSKRETFEQVHKIVGNGPVPALAGKAKAYFATYGCSLHSKAVGSFEELQRAVDADQACAILLSKGIVDWHWLLCVGYRAYSSGKDYMQVIDGWHDATDIFYPVASKACWWSATKYWLE